MAADGPPCVDLGNPTCPIRVKYHNADTGLRTCFRCQLSHPYLFRSVAGKRHAMPPSTRLPLPSRWSHCLCSLPGVGSGRTGGRGCAEERVLPAPALTTSRR